MTPLPQADPPARTTTVGSELEILRSWLDFHRQTLRWKIGGLTVEEATTATVDPSGLTLGGLVRHLSDCERGWFRVVGGGDRSLEELFTDEADEFLSTPQSVVADLARWEEEVAGADVVLEGADLDAVVSTPSGERTFSLRWVLVHMAEWGPRPPGGEYARHDGHADFLRERTDGATGDR